MTRNNIPVICLLCFMMCAFSVSGQDIHKMLTASSWKNKVTRIDPSGDTLGNVDIFNFHDDGTFTQIVPGADFAIEGTWRWTAVNEFYLLPLSIGLKGIREDYPQRLGYYYRIVELRMDHLKVLVRFETDTWDSGFATEAVYYR